jgi:hypothetical protein
MASGTTPICDASTRKDDTETSGHGPPIVLGTVIGLITEGPDAPIYRDTGQWGKDSKPRAKGNVKVAKHVMGLIQQRAGVETVVAKAEQLLTKRTGRL